jgi:hypothetical protein
VDNLFGAEEGRRGRMCNEGVDHVSVTGWRATQDPAAAKPDRNAGRLRAPSIRGSRIVRKLSRGRMATAGRGKCSASVLQGGAGNCERSRGHERAPIEESKYGKREGLITSVRGRYGAWPRAAKALSIVMRRGEFGRDGGRRAAKPGKNAGYSVGDTVHRQAI